MGTGTMCLAPSWKVTPDNRNQTIMLSEMKELFAATEHGAVLLPSFKRLLVHKDVRREKDPTRESDEKKELRRRSKELFGEVSVLRIFAMSKDEFESLLELASTEASLFIQALRRWGVRGKDSDAKPTTASSHAGGDTTSLPSMLELQLTKEALGGRSSSRDPAAVAASLLSHSFKLQSELLGLGYLLVGREAADDETSNVEGAHTAPAVGVDGVSALRWHVQLTYVHFSFFIKSELWTLLRSV